MRKMKGLTLCAMVLMLAVVFSGCMKIQSGVVWYEDNTGDVIVSIGVNNAVAELMEMTAEELQEELRESIEDAVDENATFESFVDSEYIGITATAKVDNMLTDTHGTAQQLNYSYSETDGKKTYTVSGDFDVTSFLEGDDDAETDLVVFEFSIVMPGTITTNNATKQDGNKLIWDMTNKTIVPVQATSVINGAGGTDEITVVIDGSPVIFDVPPRIVNDRTLVPLRAIFEELGATVEWDGNTQTVTATKDNTVVELTIGNNTPTINGEIVTIDQPGIIVDSRTLAPLRFVAEAFGGTVEWNGASRTASITR
ncbi:MAG: copper amine oxidase N-terminal domain-containing protein [Peptococcaceae bacterium]|nr:copper amine oxidase N-terminal domain-containing protein [Peptococcaceae bacterium]